MSSPDVLLFSTQDRDSSGALLQISGEEEEEEEQEESPSVAGQIIAGVQ